MNPYLVQRPAIVQFSGGRTSAYMLSQMLLAHGGALPDDVVVAFENTGKERIETLDFVKACSDHWSVPIHWLEYGSDGFREVTYETASREGEPFEALVAKKKFLPNPVTRFCTIELKIRVMRDFAKSLGWNHWTSVVGLRKDEPGRVFKAYARNDEGKERWVTVCPLYDDGVEEADVLAFWKAQPFDLALESYEGNCDLCFLKGAGKTTRIMRDNPALADWWIRMEAKTLASKPSGARFRNDRPSYAELLERTQRQGELPFSLFDDHTSCVDTCTD